MTSPLCRHLHWLTILPVVAAVLIYHRDVPYHDQWDLLPLLDAYYQGRFDIEQLLVPHNGHILLLSQGVMLLLAISTHWNTFAEVLCSLVLGVFNFGVFLLLARSLSDPHRAVFPRVALGILVFSLAQADNWLWGWQLQVPLCLGGVLTGFLALRCIASPWLAIATATLCGLAASFSFAAGLVFWFAALPLVLNRQPRWLLLWLVISASCIGLYLHLLGDTARVPHSDHDPDLLFSRSAVFGIIQNTLVCLGSLAARFTTPTSLLAGVLGLGWMAALLRMASAQDRPPLVALALFGVGSALLIALSRGNMGTEQMLTSRYTTLCLPFWASLLFALRLQTPGRTMGTVFLSLILCTSLYSLKDVHRLHNRLVRGEIALSLPDAPEGRKALAVINPRKDPVQARQEVSQLAVYRLSFYRTAHNKTHQ